MLPRCGVSLLFPNLRRRPIVDADEHNLLIYAMAVWAKELSEKTLPVL